ncbi:uncharacterized protein LOC110265321 [Arachis ipaensis]|uniref:uncharacterized protein LOC110265321 n=1 Tax=Arachis ipaensis TaxID=130454 RepID=UPI000A2B86A3|nr:uncharacterized protein LOC110265321 [Arachis ipaensis]
MVDRRRHLKAWPPSKTQRRRSGGDSGLLAGAVPPFFPLLLPVLLLSSIFWVCCVKRESEREQGRVQLLGKRERRLARESPREGVRRRVPLPAPPPSTLPAASLRSRRIEGVRVAVRSAIRSPVPRRFCHRRQCPAVAAAAAGSCTAVTELLPLRTATAAAGNATAVSVSSPEI